MKKLLALSAAAMLVALVAMPQQAAAFHRSGVHIVIRVGSVAHRHKHCHRVKVLKKSGKRVTITSCHRHSHRHGHH